MYLMSITNIGHRTDAADTSSPSTQEEGSGYLMHLQEDEQDATPGWAMWLASFDPIERYRAWRCRRQRWFNNAFEAVVFWCAICWVAFWVPVLCWILL